MKLAGKARDILLKFGLGRFHIDNIGQLVIERYQHGGFVTNTVPLAGTVELMYRTDGKQVHSNETAYGRVDGAVEEEKTERAFSLRILNNLEANLSLPNQLVNQACTSLLWELMQIGR
jgi:uncharacterized protein (DUF2126 family)